MLSHACASCGKPLGAASRRFVPALAMWVATCPRCGSAVRWSPTAARAGVRTWARLRAINLRLGIAFTAGQAAGLLLFVAIAFLVSGDLRPRPGGAGLRDWLATPLPLVVALVAAGAGVSAAAIAPGRGVLARVAVAWAVCLAPVVLFLAAIVGGAELADGLGTSYRRLAERLGIGLATATIAFLLSIPAGAIATIVYAPFGRLAARRHARALRSSAAIEARPGAPRAARA